MLAKRELLFVPLIGWTWYFLEIVFCKRKWEEDRDTVVGGLRRLADYPEYMWVSPCVAAHARARPATEAPVGRLAVGPARGAGLGDTRPHGPSRDPSRDPSRTQGAGREGGGFLPAQQRGSRRGECRCPTGAQPEPPLQGRSSLEASFRANQ